MNRGEEQDDLLSGLASLPVHDVDAGRSREVLTHATAALRRRARFAAAAFFYTRYLEPVAAGVLSLAVLGLTAANALFVLQHGIGLWR